MHAMPNVKKIAKIWGKRKMNEVFNPIFPGGIDKHTHTLTTF